MESPNREGKFSAAPFARLLFDLWREAASGKLCLQNGAEKRVLHLENGDVIVEREGLSEKEFLATLAKKHVLSAEQARQCERMAKARRYSSIRALGELGFLSPLPLWNLIESFFARRLFAFFDWEDGLFAFEAGVGLPVRERLALIPSQDLILQGVRQMQNAAVFERFLPEENASLQISAPSHLHRIAWEPHERYVLQVVGSVPNLKSFYEACELGRKEAQRALFTLLALDVLSAAGGAKPRPRAQSENAPEGDGRALEALNEKCAFLYKYVTKEVGPLGRTIVARAIEEIKPGLGPLFQKVVLHPDGRLEADTGAQPNADHLPEEMLRSLLRGYEEILLAEVLAVRKALGSRHEAALVKALEKIGCP